jgi:hypothetical protein
VAIKEINTFIKSNKEDAMWFAQQMEDAEVHTLYVMDGFTKAEQPSGYLVVPIKKGSDTGSIEELLSLPSFDAVEHYIADNRTKEFVLMGEDLAVLIYLTRLGNNNPILKNAVRDLISRVKKKG